MVGFESKWALTREAMMLTLGIVDEASERILGLEGRRPRRPLRLSVRTTKEDSNDRSGTLIMFVTITGPSLHPEILRTTVVSASVSLFLQLALWSSSYICLSFLVLVSQVCHYKPPVSHHQTLVTEGVKTLWHRITFFDHSHCQTFLETAELAAVSPPLVHWTVFIGKAHILCIFLYSSLSNREKWQIICLHGCKQHAKQKTNIQKSTTI